MRSWSIQNEIQREACRSLGISFLSPPDATLTKEKFLRPKLFAADTTHANIIYGKYVLEQIYEKMQITSTSQ
jgi:hypothetical protein